MAIQFNVATRNARLDAIESTAGTSVSLEIRSGTKPATCATAPAGNTVLSTINVPTDWMAAASGGSKAYTATWQDADMDNTETATHFRMYTSQATKDETTCFMQGTVGVGTGDLQVNSTSFAPGGTFTITQFTLTDGNA